MTPSVNGRFEILAQLGEGGMGVVYQARDTTLKRVVALKFLSPERAGSADQRARFLHEAQSASALNHPNIITIHDVVKQPDGDVIVMEYVEGRTLYALIGREGLRLAEALRIGVEIAKALAAAHAAGIVHRDLKPGNIMVKPDGAVKVLDFGLAKTAEAGAAESTSTRTLRNDQPRTEEGALVGTIAYMSPEQAEGRKVDARSDIFSFGAVLYEMLTGHRAFSGDSRLSTLTAILRDDPKLPPEGMQPLPRDVERVLTRCLRKDPSRRFQHMDDLKVALEELRDESVSGAFAEPMQKPSHRQSRVAMIVGLSAALALGAGGAWWLVNRNLPAIHKPPRALTFGSGLASSPAISPDGKLVAYSSDRAGGDNLSIWLHQVSSGQAVRLTHLPGSQYSPAFSPDGSTIAFSNGRPAGLYVIPAIGGEPRKLTGQGLSPQFSPDGATLAFVQNLPDGPATFTIPANGGPPRRVAPDLGYANYPQWTPDGKHILLMGTKDVRAANPEDWDLWVAPVEGGSARRINAVAALRRQNILVSQQSRLPILGLARNAVLFPLAGDSIANIWELPLSPQTWLPAGSAQQLTFGTGFDLADSVSTNGLLAFASQVTSWDYWSVPLDGNAGTTQGELQRVTRNSGSQTSANVTEDGSSVVYCSNKGGNSDIWKSRPDTQQDSVVLGTKAEEHLLMLSADGGKFVYEVWGRGGERTSYWTAGGPPAKICEHCTVILSYDGNRVFYTSNVVGVRELMMMNPVTGARQQVLAPTQDICFPCLPTARLSPDGAWGAFHHTNTETNRGEILLVPYRDERFQVKELFVVATGTGPKWSPDGNLLYFYSSADGHRCIWAQKLQPGTRRPAGEPFAVWHFHSARPLNGPGEFAVTRNKLVVNMQEGRSNIWLTEISR